MKIEEAIKEIKSCADNFWGALNEAFEMAINALEKQMPKRPIERKAGFKSFDYECPCCESRIISKIDGDWIAGKMQRFCDACGQALDWNDQPTEKGGEADA